MYEKVSFLFIGVKEEYFAGKENIECACMRVYLFYGHACCKEEGFHLGRSYVVLVCGSKNNCYMEWML
jgi:hypothetical protein